MDMETISIESSTEREEGEIFDDDLEDISDTSITSISWMGKFSSHKESLRALSLSSVSDLEVGEYQPPPPPPRVKRKKTRRRKIKTCVPKCVSKPIEIVSDSTDSDENVSLTKKLLREAIRRGNKEEIHNNSLRTRLKGMVNENVQVLKDSEENVPETIIITTPSPLASPVRNSSEPCEETNENKASQDSHSSEEDTELIQLRLEALKTAVINKFEHRKKKKIEKSQEDNSNLEIDKENNSDPVNTVAEENSNSGECPEENSTNNNASGNSLNNSEEDEDEDILRAVLLASIAKKITNHRVPTPSKPKSGPNKIVQKKIVKPIPPKPHPIVDPKISISNLNIENKVKPPQFVPTIPRFIISVNNPDSNSDDEETNTNSNSQSISEQSSQDIHKKVEDEVEKFLKQQRAMVEANEKKTTATVPAEATQTIPRMSIPETNNLYKLLPKSKQLEYEKLIQKLKNAEKKPRIRKPSCRTSIFKSKTKILKKNNVAVSPNKSQLKGALQRTLIDMQTQVDGRLQIKGRYHVLTPLMKRLNEASQEQKKFEVRINSLLTELKNARSQFEKSQENFDSLLKEFLQKKDEIDHRTQNKIAKPLGNLEVKIDFKNPPTKPHHQIPIASDTIHQCNNSIPINLKDPSAVEFRNEGGKSETETVSLLKYTSPLDNNGSFNSRINPLEILCPFEINGSCRDKECTFNHCTNAPTI